ncbi:MAG: ABC transporter ATP-binding protein [Bacteroidales bacterium]|jgi:lipoprotein-releasing system ATP-binding protein|nr:ABC transporter ATP-binding protein [Bacteroidales bacterium]
MIHIVDIKKNYGQLEVLKGISLPLPQGKIITITGPSGAGKSTLLHIAGSLEKPDAGQVYIDGVSIFDLSNDALSEFRNQNIGFVFQFHHLLPEFTALENVAMPALIKGINKKTSFVEATKLLDIMNLSNRATHKPAQLSGGEQQRVAVARALVNHPKIVLADEPSGNLDSENAHQLHQLFFDLRDRFNQTFFIVTHNEDLAKMSDMQIQMKDGKIL